MERSYNQLAMSMNCATLMTKDKVKNNNNNKIKFKKKKKSEHSRIYTLYIEQSYKEIDPQITKIKSKERITTSAKKIVASDTSF